MGKKKNRNKAVNGVAVLDAAAEKLDAGALGAIDDFPLSVADVLQKLQMMRDELPGIVHDNWDGEECDLAGKVWKHFERFEGVIMGVLAQYENLRGRLKVLSSESYVANVVAAAVKAAVESMDPVDRRVIVPIAAVEPAAIPNDKGVVAPVAADEPVVEHVATNEHTVVPVGERMILPVDGLAVKPVNECVVIPVAADKPVVGHVAINEHTVVPVGEHMVLPDDGLAMKSVNECVVTSVAADKPVVVSVEELERTVVPVVAVPTAAAVAVPVETWSVVIRGKKGVSSREVLEKVEKQVGPSLGVRVHEMKPTRDGGAVIRTRSAAEREKILKNLKFKEAGLSVTVNEKFGSKVVVCRVHSEITADEFMADLYELNLKNFMSLEKFHKSVRIVSKLGGTERGNIDVVLEGDEAVMKRLLEFGSVYVKWFCFRTRMQDAVPHCFRCLGFDHRIGQCRYGDVVCRRCGKGGHLASRCESPLSCRNCKIRGLPSDHSMLSMSCPMYATLVARAMARH